MNSNPHLASFWKGRLLLSVDITENPLPKLTTIPELIPQETLQMFKKDSTLQWKLFIEVYYGLGFPENGPFSIEIRWADFEIKTSVKSPENGVWEWYSRFNITCDFPYFNADELPDIFIYLLQGEKRICYIRKAANYFLHQFNSTPEHWYFTPDKAMVPDLKDDEAGLLKFRCVVAVAQAISDLSVGGWNSPIVKKNRKKV